jgi:hypothetical protein
MSTIASLDVGLALNSAKFIEGLRKARKEHEDFANSLAHFADRASSFGESLGIHVDSDFSIRGMVEKARDAQETQTKLAAVLRATGDAAGYNEEGMNRIAEQLSHVSTFSVEAAKSAETMLATFTHIRGAQFEGAIKAASDLATIFNVDLTTAAQKVGRALENPGEGLKSLAKMGVQFSDSQKQVIEKLVETGKVADAQAEILKAINAKVGGSAAAAAKTATGEMAQLKNEFQEIAANIGSNFLPAVEKAISVVNVAAAAAKSAAAVFKTLEAVEAEAGAMAAIAGGPVTIAIGAGLAAVTSIGLVVKKIFDDDAKSAKELADSHQRAATAARNQADALADLKQKAQQSAEAFKEVAKNLALAVQPGATPMSKLSDKLFEWKQELEMVEAELKNVQPTGNQQLYKGLSDQAKLLKDNIDVLQREKNNAESMVEHTEAIRGMKEELQHAQSLKESLMTPMEHFRESVKELKSLADARRIDNQTFGRGLVRAYDELKSQTGTAPGVAALDKGSAAALSASHQRDRENNDPSLDIQRKELEELITANQNTEAIRRAIENLLGPTLSAL